MEINTCIWTVDGREHDETVFDTGCGNRHEFIVGGITDNNYKFCPYCGKRIKEGGPDPYAIKEVDWSKVPEDVKENIRGQI